MSALSYAAVTLTVFSPSTTISSTDMNTNFSTIAAKLNELDVGFAVRLSTNFALTTCSNVNMNPLAADMEVIQAALVDHNDGNFNTGTWEYTIPATGIYRIYAEAPNTLASPMGYDLRLDIYTTSTWASEYISGQVVKRFTTGQKVRILAGCGYKFTNYTTPAVVDAAKFIFALKKF